MASLGKRGNLVPVRRNDDVMTTQNAEPMAPASAPARWNPWQEFAALDRWFDEFMGRSFAPLGLTPRRWGWGGDYGFGQPLNEAGGAQSPAIDLYETPEEVILFAYAPGAKKDAFDIAVGNGTVTIRGERQPLIEGENVTAYGSGIARMQGTFETTYRLPVEVDASHARASYNNGVLELHLPKTEAAKVKHLKVSVES